MTDNTTDTTNATTTPDATTTDPTPTSDVTPTPTPTRTPARRSRGTVRTPDASAIVTPARYNGSGIDAVVAIARTVTPATFARTVARYTVNHGVTHAARNIGRATNDRIVAFQNRVMRDNASWQLDDCQIAAMMRIEFPMAAGRLVRGTPSDGVSIVRGIRAEYNRPGHHGATFAVTADAVSYGPRKFVFPTVTPASDPTV